MRVPAVLAAGRIPQISTPYRGRLIIAPTDLKIFKFPPHKNLPLWGRWHGVAVTKEVAAQGCNIQPVSGENAPAKIPKPGTFMPQNREYSNEYLHIR
jgi:hypothetical protein